MGMSRGYARFTQADLHRAIKAIAQSGADLAVEILPDGTIRIGRNRADPVREAAVVVPRLVL